MPLAEREKLILTQFDRGLAYETIRLQLSDDTKLITTKTVDNSSAIAPVLHPKSRQQQSNRRRDSDLKANASSYATAYCIEPFFAVIFADRFDKKRR